MLGFLVQAAETTNSLDIGDYTQALFKSLVGVDVMLTFRLLFAWLFIIWVIFALWVAVDAVNRYRQWPVAVFWFLFVVPFNVLGFIGYLFMRPVVTLEEKQWTKLESKYLMYELSSVNDCPSCHTLVPTSHNYCAVCGTQMNVNCPKCDVLQSIYNGFCSSCGTKLTPEEKKVVDELVAEQASVGTSSEVSTVKKVTLAERLSQAVKKIKASIDSSTKALSRAMTPKKKEKSAKSDKKESKESTEAKSS